VPIEATAYSARNAATAVVVVFGVHAAAHRNELGRVQGKGRDRSKRIGVTIHRAIHHRARGFLGPHATRIIHITRHLLLVGREDHAVFLVPAHAAVVGVAFAIIYM